MTLPCGCNWELGRTCQPCRERWARERAVQNMVEGVGEMVSALQDLVTSHERSLKQLEREAEDV